ncbi:MAG: hypothetical protein LBN24_11760 [Mediterranea sp.]|nr:hypothetical protein [Mediterranea sp.]
MDDDFIHYVLGEASDEASKWNSYFVAHPDQREYARAAKEILKAAPDVPTSFSVTEREELKAGIMDSIKEVSGK